MCGKACASESAAAMAVFVQQFEGVGEMHNGFAREMNGEMGGHVHEGFEMVGFPVVVEGVGGGEKKKGGLEKKGRGVSEGDGEVVVPVKKKRRVKIETGRGGGVLGASPVSEQSVLGLVSPSWVSSSRGRDGEVASGSSDASALSRRDAWLSRSPSPLSSVPSSPEPASGEEAASTSARTLPRASTDSRTLHTRPSSTERGNEKEDVEERGSPLPSVPSSPVLAGRKAAPSNPPPAPVSPSSPSAPTWDAGRLAIEAFDWSGTGSQWVAGRGWVSVYYDAGDEMDVTGNLFRGHLWDDAGADGLGGEVDGEVVGLGEGESEWEVMGVSKGGGE